MQLKNIYELLNYFLKDGFSIDILGKVTGVSKELIERCIKHDNISNEEIVILGKVVSFLGMLYMVDVDDSTYLKESISALEQFYHIPKNAIASYCGFSSAELEKFLENPETHPNGYKISVKLMHLRTVLLQRME